MKLQSLIDRCADSGGGTVTLPPGEHRIGTLHLRSNVTVEIPRETRLLASDHLEDFPAPPTGNFVDAVGQQRGRAVIVAEGVSNAGLIGHGTIDGNGAAFRSGPAYASRPFLVRLSNCSNIHLRDVSLISSPAWVCHLYRCSNVSIDSLRIHSHVNHNNDGIDIDSCSNVTVRNCDIDTGDDALCLKATSELPCRNITVEHCRLSSRCGTIKLGTESYGDFRDIAIRHCEVLHAGLSAIKVITVDGGIIDNVDISDIRVHSGTGPIFVRVGARCKTYFPNLPARPPGTIRNLRIARVRAANVSLHPAGDINYFTKQHMPPDSFAGILVTGLPDHPVESLSLSDIDAVFPGNADPALLEATPPEMNTDYPEQFYFGPLPAFGLYARHVCSLSTHNLHLRSQLPDPRPATKLVNVAAHNQA